MKKTYYLNLLAVIGLIASFLVAPAGVVLAAPEWTCTSVTLNSGGGINKNVTVTLNHSTANSELIDLNWGDGSPLVIIHAANTTTYLPNSQSHNYGNAAGTYNITMRVWSATPDGTDNDDGDDWHQCGTTVTFSGCAPSGAIACKLSPMDSTNHVTATVSYVATGGNTASIDWGDSTTTTLPTGTHTNLVVLPSHHYLSNSTFTVKLMIVSPTGAPVTTCILVTTNTPSDVTLSSMSAESPEGGINWTAIAFALLGVVVLGQVALFAVRRRR